MRRLLAAVAMSSALHAHAQTAPPEPASASITVQASGFKDDQGQAIAKLFQPGDDVLAAGRWEAKSHIHDGHATLVLPALPAGRYALVVFHDRNGNGQIDHGLLGPSEALGFSGGFRLSLFSGRPTFDELKFEFNGQAATMEVRVR
jgi:uncharacterized protein (DUF2141 family)